MKKIIKKTAGLVMVLAIAFYSNSTYAQQDGGKGGRQQGPPPIPTTKQIKKMVNELADEISLTEKQEAQVLELYTNHFEEIENKTKSGRPDREEMKSLRENFEDDVKSELTDDQKELYANYLRNHGPEKRAKNKDRK